MPPAPLNSPQQAPSSQRPTSQASPSGGESKQKHQKQSPRVTSSSTEPPAASRDLKRLPSTFTASVAAPPPAPAPTGGQQQEKNAADTDAALYRDMRQALADFQQAQQNLLSQHSQQSSTAAPPGGNGSSKSGSSSRPARMPPRQTAFYAALHSILQQVLAETTPMGRHTSLMAAHAWYVGHKPHMTTADSGSGAAAADSLHLAAAMATSLSISPPPAHQQQQEQQEQELRCVVRVIRLV